MSITKVVAIGSAITLAATDHSYHLRGTNRQLQVDLPDSTPSPSSATSYPMPSWAPTLVPTLIPTDDKRNQTTSNLSKNNHKNRKKEKKRKLASLFTKENIITKLCS